MCTYLIDSVVYDTYCVYSKNYALSTVHIIVLQLVLQSGFLYKMKDSSGLY